MPPLSRRHLHVALGLLWLFDGVLQAQPSMFSPYFYGMMLGMSPSAPPGWLYDAQARFWPLVTAHSALWNGAFAALQILIGLGLLFRRTTKVALAVSVPWAL